MFDLPPFLHGCEQNLGPQFFKPGFGDSLIGRVGKIDRMLGQHEVIQLMLPMGGDPAAVLFDHDLSQGDTVLIGFKIIGSQFGLFACA
ncbi:hypothetical protein D3C76_1662720 [compost metagenome]